MLQRVKEVQESDLRMNGALARNIQRVLAVTQAQIDAAAAQGQSWFVKPVVKVSDPLDNLRGGTQLVIKQNSILPGQNVMRVIYRGGQAVVVGPGVAPLSLPDAAAEDIMSLIAFGGTEQRNIPKEYTQLGGLVFDGSSYVDTGLTSFSNDGVYECDFVTSTLSTMFIFGQNPSTSSPQVGFFVTSSNFVWQYGASSRLTASNTANTAYNIVTENGKLTINGTATTGTASETITINQHLFVGAGVTPSANPDSNNPDARMFAGTIKRFKYTLAGVVMCDLVPAKRNSDNVLGFYDTVSETFLTNAGTGAFTSAGAVAPTPDAPIDIVCNNGVLKVGQTVTIDPTRNYAYINTNGNWAWSNDSYSIALPVEVGKKYKIDITNTDAAVVGVIFRYGFTDTDPEDFKQSEVTPSPTSISIYDYWRGTPQDLPEVEVTATHPYLVVQFAAAYAATVVSTYLTIKKQVAYADGPIETIAIKDDQNTTVSTATCEDLLSIGTYTDQQEIIDGTVTRKVGVLVLDGTENWTRATNQDGSANYVFYTQIDDKKVGNNQPMLCSHHEYIGSGSYVTLTAGKFLSNANNTSVYFDGGSITTATNWKNWLATQYANGTPVIVIYPLATETTETVTGQPMQTAAGNNTAEITQAGMAGLELEVEYLKDE